MKQVTLSFKMHNPGTYSISSRIKLKEEEQQKKAK